jgi:hypothetical protein
MGKLERVLVALSAVAVRSPTGIPIDGILKMFARVAVLVVGRFAVTDLADTIIVGGTHYIGTKCD